MKKNFPCYFSLLALYALLLKGCWGRGMTQGVKCWSFRWVEMIWPSCENWKQIISTRVSRGKYAHDKKIKLNDNGLLFYINYEDKINFTTDISTWLNIVSGKKEEIKMRWNILYDLYFCGGFLFFSLHLFWVSPSFRAPWTKRKNFLVAFNNNDNIGKRFFVNIQEWFYFLYLIICYISVLFFSLFFISNHMCILYFFY